MSTNYNAKFKLARVILFLLFCLFFYNGNAQKREGLKITGEAGAYADFYHMKSDTAGAVAARRPDFLGRFVVSATLSYKYFSLPITMNLPTGQFGVLLPTIPAIPNKPVENIRNFVFNPLNRVGIAPKYKWAQVLLGSQIPQYSALTIGDVAVFGAGVNLNPGKFRFAAFGGKSQLGVNEDSAKRIKGIYARKIYSAKIGIGHEDSSHIYLIASKMFDDTNSVAVRNPGLMPQNGIVNSIDFRLNVTGKTYVKGEVAGSAFTRDSRSPEAPAFTPALPRSIFIPKISSRLDYAAILSLGKTGKIFNYTLTGRYYGDGFVPMGYPYLQTDRMELTLDPKLSLLKSKFQLSGTVGRRINNLSGIRATTTTQTLGATNLNIQFADNFSIQGNYTNFGFKNAISNDTLKVNMITQAYGGGFAYNHNGIKFMQSISLIAGRNKFTDLNIISGSLNANDAMNGAVTYVLTSVKKPLTINSMFSYLNNRIGAGTLNAKSLNAGLGYKFMKKKLNTNLGVNITNNALNNIPSGAQLMLLLGVKYAIKKNINFTINASINMYKYQSIKPGISYQENLLRTSLTYKF